MKNDKIRQAQSHTLKVATFDEELYRSRVYHQQTTMANPNTPPERFHRRALDKMHSSTRRCIERQNISAETSPSDSSHKERNPIQNFVKHLAHEIDEPNHRYDDVVIEAGYNSEYHIDTSAEMISSSASLQSSEALSNSRFQDDLSVTSSETAEDLSSVSSVEHGKLRKLRLSMDFSRECQRRRNKNFIEQSSPNAIEELCYIADPELKDAEAKRLYKKRSSKSTLAKRIAFQGQRKLRPDFFADDSSVSSGRQTAIQVIFALAATFIFLLICILSALSSISKEIVESSSHMLHPQLEVADLVDQKFKLFEKKITRSAAYQHPTLLDALSHKMTGQEENAANNEASSLAQVIGTEKPLSEITWHDLNFSKKTETSASCSTPISADDVSFTLVTQVSEDRLWMLTQHCQRWQGPISAAVFTDLSATHISQAITQDSHVYGSCSTDQIYIQTFAKSKFTAEDYPVNALRNMALRGVKTSHFFYADIDFWASDDLYAALHTDFMRRQLASDPQLALVVPAFQMTRVCKEERDCRTENMLQMPHHKKSLVDLVRQHKASAFDPTNRGGHGSTSYSEWFNMAHGDLWDIPCILSNRYEPYIGARYCSEFPPYQEVFTGYGKNKMTHIMQLRRSGYLFSQVGGVFVVHYPHLSSATRKAWNHGKKKHDELVESESNGQEIDWTKFKRGQVDKIFVEFRKWLESDVEDVARVQMCPDALNDDEKLWV